MTFCVYLYRVWLPVSHQDERHCICRKKPTADISRLSNFVPSQLGTLIEQRGLSRS